MNPPPLDAQSLLQHADGLRRLARSLVFRDEEAEDVVQETWVAVAEGAAPTRGGSPGGWLRGVVRRVAGKLARGESRRRRREALVATFAPPSVPAADEAAERLDTRRQVLDALQRLSDPQRYALFLRYFEGLEPAAIAARQEVPVTTVKSWLKRGLERLRADLDERHGGDRSAWHAALLPLGAAPALAGAVATTGGLSAAKVAVALAAVVVAGFAVERFVLAPLRDEPAPREPKGAARAPKDAGPRLEGRAPAKPHLADGRTGLPPAPPAREELPGDLVYVGRVMDDRRRPQPGALVIVHFPDYAERSALTDLEGRFRVALGPPHAEPSRGMVIARTPDGRAAAWIANAGPQEARAPMEIEGLVVGPARDLTVRVERDGKPVAGARLSVCHSRSYGRTEVAQLTTDTTGQGTVRTLPLGTYWLAAAATGHGRGSTLHELEADGSHAAVVALTAPRTIEIRVTDSGSERPVAGAELVVSEQVKRGYLLAPYLPRLAVALTDEHGRTRLEGLGAVEEIHLTARAEGFATGSHAYPPVMAVPADAKTFTLALQRLRAISWPLKAGDRPVPPDGTVLAVSSDDETFTLPLPKEVRIEGGRLVGTGFTPALVRALAQTPDGAYVRLVAPQDVVPSKELTVHALRPVEVIVHWADGSPARGLPIQIRARGDGGSKGPVPLDADGRAVVPFAHDGTAVVSVDGSSERFDGMDLGDVDLAGRAPRLEVTLPPERAVRLQVRIAGRPRLPTELNIGASPSVTSRVAEDPENGLVTFRMAAPSRLPGEVATLYVGKAPTLFVSATGFAPATIPVPPGNGPIEVSVDLEPAGLLVLRVKKPTDGGVSVATVQQFDAAKKAWRALRPPLPPPVTVGLVEETPTERIVRYTPVPAGRYRAVDQATGDATEPVELVPGSVAPEVVLDLTRSASVSGTIEIPAGFDVKGAQVELEGMSREGFLSGRAGTGTVEADGRFSIRVPGWRPVVIRGIHPLLVPHAGEGRVEVQEGREGVRLRLVTGTSGRLTLPPVPRGPVTASPRALGLLKILLFAGEPAGDPVGEYPLLEADGVLRFGGYAPGTYTLWLDAGEGAPIVRRGVVLGPEPTDLGLLEPTPGSRVRVKVLVPEGFLAPMVAVQAAAEGKPAYYRHAASKAGATEAVLTGLGPGRFKVTAAPLQPNTRFNRSLERVIDVDGSDEVVLELDLR